MSGTHEQYKLNHRVNENGIIERRCSKCQEWKEENINNFYMMNKSKPERGFASACKICMSKDSNKHQKENREQYYEYKTDWHNKNAEKHTQQKRDWHQEHKGKRQEDYRNFCGNNPDKVRGYGQDRRKKNHKITKKQWIECKDYFKNDQGEWSCAYCGLPISQHFKMFHGEPRQIDLHREHVDDDGANDLSNCVPSCKMCNSSKWKFSLEEWYNESNIIYNENRYNKIMKWLNEDYKKFIIDVKEQKGKVS